MEWIRKICQIRALDEQKRIKVNLFADQDGVKFNEAISSFMAELLKEKKLYLTLDGCGCHTPYHIDISTEEEWPS